MRNRTCAYAPNCSVFAHTVPLFSYLSLLLLLQTMMEAVISYRGRRRRRSLSAIPDSTGGRPSSPAPGTSLAGRLSLVSFRQCHTDGEIPGAASDPPRQVSGRWAGLRQQLDSGSLPLRGIRRSGRTDVILGSHVARPPDRDQAGAEAVSFPHARAASPVFQASSRRPTEFNEHSSNGDFGLESY